MTKNRGLQRVICGAALGAGAIVSAPAGAETIDFNSLQTGTVINNQFQSQGLTISADNFNSNSFNVATLFNTTGGGGADLDLQAPFDLGHYAGSGPGGKILIIQDQTQRTMVSGRVAGPNDEGGRPAGKFVFQFDRPIDEFGFDLLDVEGPEEYGPNSGYFATFFGGGAEIRIGFELFITPSSDFYRPGVVYGNNSGNIISPITAESLNLVNFDRVEINLGGSGGIDNINYQFWVLPEPTSFLLSGIGISALGFRRRRI